MIQAEGDADVDIVKAAVAVASFKSTLIGEHTDLLVLLLRYAEKDCKDLYFRSDKDKPYVYGIKVLKRLLSDDIVRICCCPCVFRLRHYCKNIWGRHEVCTCTKLPMVILYYRLVPRHFALPVWIKNM